MYTDGQSIKQSWWDGNSTRMWRLLILVYLALLGFLGAWIFQSLVEFPKIYAEKTEVNRLMDKVDRGFDRLADKIDEKFTQCKKGGG